MPRLLLTLLSALCLGQTIAFAQGPSWPSPPREFRGVWVATVANIDWPSKKGLSTEEQKAELLKILNRTVELRLNAVVFQIRPMADALYASEREPWSEFLTGKLGQAPEPVYDPLAFAIREAHARGLELHAWFNPYRARHPSATSPLPDGHLVKSRPDLAKPYGKHHWLNPTHPDVQSHSLGVILDVVRRYDLDGVHLDDYFYPYPETDAGGKAIPFPDDDTWGAYQRAGGKLSRDDWRRDAVDRFVERLYRDVKNAKPWVKVGISPFGIWRPGHPAGIAGFDQYDQLYADAKRWLNEGWCDYFTPQLYWPIKQEKQSYPRLLAWWVDQNSKGRHIWPGNIPSRVTGTEKGWPASEIADQVRATRAQKGATGNIHFSMQVFLRNTGGVSDAIREVYAEPALVPASPWLAERPPGKPTLTWKDQALQIRPPEEPVRLYVVRNRTADKWTMHIHPATDQVVAVRYDVRPEEVVVTAIDRAGNESEAVKAEK